jgi:hypothetical protein
MPAPALIRPIPPNFFYLSSTKKGRQGPGPILVREILINHGFDFSLKTVTQRQTAFTITFN